MSYAETKQLITEDTEKRRVKEMTGEITQLLFQHQALTAPQINHLVSYGNPSNDCKEITSKALAKMGKQLTYSVPSKQHRLR